MDAEPRLEKLAAGLSISCFRYRPDGAGPEAIDRINARIQAQLVATGDIALSPTTLDGRYSLRVCIVNFRPRRADIDWLLERGLAFGDRTSVVEGTSVSGRVGIGGCRTHKKKKQQT